MTAVKKIWQDNYQLFIDGKWRDGEGAKFCGFIYSFTNKINGKIYVGKTIQSLKRRMKSHERANSLIGNAIRKYGWDNFEIKVIEPCEKIEQLNEREKHFITQLNCKYPNGYNITNGGDGGATTIGRHHSVATKQKMSISRKKYFAEHPEAKIYLSKVNKGKKPSALAIKRIIEVNTGRKYTDLVKTNMSIGQKNRYNKPGAREAKSIEQRRRYENPIEREKAAARNRGRKQTPESKIKTAAAKIKNIVFPNFEEELKRQKITRRGLAKILGVSHTSIIEKLNGKREMDLETAIKIYKMLQIDISLEKLFNF